MGSEMCIRDRRNYLQLREVSERLYILVGTGTVDRAVAEEVFAQEDVIKTATFGAPTLESDLYILRPLADTERDIAHLVVDHLHGNRTRAAEVLGISRTTLWRLLKAMLWRYPNKQRHGCALSPRSPERTLGFGSILKER